MEPVFEAAEQQAEAHPERRDVFLCHAWDDREGYAKDLHDLLEARGVSVWFSEKDVALGSSLLRAIDNGLRISRIGIVLATPALLKSLEAQGTADKELSALLATERVIPVAHGTTFDAVRDISPLLAARAGLTSAGSLDDIAAKLRTPSRCSRSPARPSRFGVGPVITQVGPLAALLGQHAYPSRDLFEAWTPLLLLRSDRCCYVVRSAARDSA